MIKSALVTEVGQYAGSAVLEAQLTSADGVIVNILSYGGIVRNWRVPVAGKLRSVVLGFENWQDYLEDDAYLGAIIGRLANRTAQAQFRLDGKTFQLPSNNGIHHHHGGPEGLSKKNWSLQLVGDDTVVLKTLSPEGEMGYPGKAEFTATYKLEGKTLLLALEAHVSQATPISLVQHHYFNLTNEKDIFGHQVQIEADQYTALDDQMIPTGEIKSVSDTAFDFRQLKRMTHNNQNQSFDLNYVLRPQRVLTKPVAIVMASDNSLKLELWTDRPGLQFYNGHYTHSKKEGHAGFQYERHSGLCLEDQAFPNAVNLSGFPSVIVYPGKPYSHWCRIRIAEETEK